MTREFLELYEQELRHIRESGAEFAATYPKIASRLYLSKDARETCADPFVERLLEGFAFLTARVQLKLEAEFPRFTQGLLETVYPDYMAPLPSASITQFTPVLGDKALMEGVKIPRGTMLNSLRLKGESTACRFSTAHEVRLYPLQVAEAAYHTRSVGELSLGNRYGTIRAAVRLRLKLHDIPAASINKLRCDHLSFYLHGEDRLPAALLGEIMAHAQGVVIREVGDHLHRRSTFLGREALRHAGFEETEAMLPFSPRSFEGHRILREHFMLPQRHLFLEVKELQAALEKLNGTQFDIIIPLAERRDDMEFFVQPDVFQLHCTPVINLFKRRSDRIPVGPGSAEYQLIIDRQHTTDFEVYSVLGVTGYTRTGSTTVNFYPFYLQPDGMNAVSGFYSVQRQQRVKSRKEQNMKVAYPGSEIFLSLVTPSAEPYPPDLEQLGTECMVTNRHLPMDMPIGLSDTDFHAEGSFPLVSVRCLVRPTVPVPSFAEGRHAWRVISHLSLNYLSLVDKGAEGAEALRALLRLYATGSGATSIVDGVRGIKSRSSLARSPGGGPVCFVRGTDIELTLDEDRYAGHGLFLFGSALEQFFARQATINCYTRLKLFTEAGKEVMSWPLRMGRIPLN